VSKGSSERHRLVDALRLVSLPADRQRGVLPNFVHPPEEVTLLFDDAYACLPSVHDAGGLTDDQARPLGELDGLFQSMTEADDKDWVWTIEAMETDVRWAKTRRLALTLLTEVTATGTGTSNRMIAFRSEVGESSRLTRGARPRARQMPEASSGAAHGGRQVAEPTGQSGWRQTPKTCSSRENPSDSYNARA
jgi:hypothetical protein